MYNTGGTIKETLDKIDARGLVLPAIQREFVWRPDQIYHLFDSLMQGYPIGTFLYWKVREESSHQFKFYDFVREYHQRDNPYCPDSGPKSRELTAVLDGQQRLTALNIGLRGSAAWKLPYKWWSSDDAFPIRRLYLDLLWQNNGEGGMEYRFGLLDESNEKQFNTNNAEICWFPVSSIFLSKDIEQLKTDWQSRLNARSPQRIEEGCSKIEKLHNVIHTGKIITYYEVYDPSLEKALQFFMRMNYSGTPLSYSDMLFSIVVSQWKRDARKEVHDLVEKLNSIGKVGFTFSKDLVLKAGLMLSDVGSVGFKAENFNRQNMEVFENKWEAIKQAMILAVRLVSSFGFSGQNLAANNAILPIAYYLCRRSPGEGYLKQSCFECDREKIRKWLIDSVLKPGVWGGSVDTLLTALRHVIKENNDGDFPASEIRTEMAGRGRTLAFDPEEIDKLVDMQYGDKRLFALLSLLFEFVDLQNHFHIDHIFPKSRFTRYRLMKAGVLEDKVDNFISYRHGLANLQLLGGQENKKKRAKMPAEWLAAEYRDPRGRQDYEDRHMLGDVPDSIVNFGDFYEARRARLREKIEELLGRHARG